MSPIIDENDIEPGWVNISLSSKGNVIYKYGEPTNNTYLLNHIQYYRRFGDFRVNALWEIQEQQRRDRINIELEEDSPYWGLDSLLPNYEYTEEELEFEYDSDSNSSESDSEQENEYD